MDEKSLDDLLRQRRETTTPALSSSFSQDVWREIRLRRASETGAVGTLSIWPWLWRPQYIAAVLAVATLVGIGLGIRPRERMATRTEQALHLEVFGAAAPTLPSTLLASNL